MSLTADQREEIASSQAQVSSTVRATVPDLEAVLYKPFPVLDHGFVRVVDYMGNDSAIVQAARVSYGRGTKKVNADRGLIHYLLRHHHTTPFEMCEIKLHIKLPIFVARQWVRHRTANINEYSARYSILDKEFYLPAAQDISFQSASNRQGRGEECSPEVSERVLGMMKRGAEQCYATYEELLGLSGQEDTGDVFSERGIARELARVNLPVNYYTQLYWKIDLHNLLHFLRLRADPHAQLEIRRYADAILRIVALWVPIAYEAFEAYQQGGTSLSKGALEVVKKWIRGESVQREDTPLSQREWDELRSTFSKD